MALVKPILQSLAAFNKSQGAIFYFNATGGDQVVKNRLTIEDVNGVVVYQAEQTSFKTEHVLPNSNNLVNGNAYVAYVNTFNIDGDISVSSNLIQFYCYTTPTLSWSNKPVDNVIKNASFQLEILYEQEEGELLDGVIINVYDEFNSLIGTSDKIYNTGSPPIELFYTLNVFENTKRYKIQITGATINQTAIASPMYIVDVEYENPVSFGLIEVRNDCNGGYVEINTNISVIAGIVEPDPPIYVDQTLDLSLKGSNVLWDSGYITSNYFQIGMWLKVVDANDVIAKLTDANGNGYTIGLKTSYDNGQYYSCATVTVYEDGSLRAYDYSELVPLLNSNSIINVWFKRDENGYTIHLNVLYREGSFIEWNGNSNVLYSGSTDIEWNNGLYPDPMNEKIDFGASQFLIKNIQLFNGFYDDVYVTNNTNEPFSSVPKTKENWDIYTVIICDFDNNVDGGNVDFALGEIERMQIKRRLKNSFTWNTIGDIEIKTLDDFKVNINDGFVPSGYDFQYAVVPILAGGIEGDYLVEEVVTQFNDIHIADINNIFKVISNPSNQTSRINASSVLQAIGSRVPYVVRNGAMNYTQGTFTAVLHGYDFEKTRVVNYQDATKQKNDMVDFLTNGNVKFITDWLGNIYMCAIVGDIGDSSNFSNGAWNLTFSYVEQGKYDNQDDLERFGLVRNGGGTSASNTRRI